MGKRRSKAALLLWHGPLLARCLATVIFFRVALFFLPYKRLAQWMPPVSPSPPSRDALRRLLWGVRSSARVVPHASCLTQALASHYLCNKAGHPTLIRIGVARETDGTILAHAWLVDAAGTLTDGGAKDLWRFTRIADLGGPIV